MRRLRETFIAVAKQLSIAYSGYVYFSALSHKRNDFRRNKSYLIQNVCFDFFYKFVWNTSHSKKNWATYKKCIGFHVKYLFFLSDFNESRIFSTDFRKIFKHQLLWKSVHWEPDCSTRIDRRTDMTNLIVAFRNFANAPKNSWWILWNWETFKYLGIK